MDMELTQAIGQMLDEKLHPIIEELQEIRQRVLKIEIKQENNITTRLNLISEDVLDINGKLDRSLLHRLQLEDHEYRIQNLEQSVGSALL